MSDRFYREFEERHYAPRDVIKELRSQYLPFVKPLANLYPNQQVFDAGCGRGEWLELMSDLGFSPFGVDLDEGMLSACLERNLAVEQGDAIAYLSLLPNESQIIVSAFHVVEHIKFDQLRVFVKEALRVLKPGGVLIMETPNPENIFVATQNFYLDPTHVRPIPSTLLSFITEYTGFKRVKTLRLQESKELVNKANLSLKNVFTGVSPDYAVIAQKNASNEILSLTSHAFDQEYGLSLDNLLNRWDKHFDEIELKAERAEIKARKAQEDVQRLIQHVQNLENKLNNLYSSKYWKLIVFFRKLKERIMRWF